MNHYELNKYLSNPVLLEESINMLITQRIIQIQDLDKAHIEGHLYKAQRNLDFVHDNIRLHYLDWSITGCYYASYHASIALLLTKMFATKNHEATLLLLIKHFYKNGLEKEDLLSLAHVLDYQDILFYVESKNRREEATYSTATKYSKKDVEQLRIKAALYVAKAKHIILN